MRKQLIALLLTVMILLPLAAFAETRHQNNETTGFAAVIDDQAGLLDVSEYDSVMAEMMKITEYCHAGFYTYDGSSRDYVTDKAKAWGRKTFTGDFTVFMIDMSTRRIAVYSSDKIYKTVTTGKSNTITDNVYTYASKGQYGECARVAFTQISNVLQGAKIEEPMRYLSNALLALVAAILLAYLLISARMEQEVKVSMPDVITATAGIGAAVVAKRLTKTVRHESHSGGGGSFGGGGGGGFSGGGGGGGSHGF